MKGSIQLKNKTYYAVIPIGGKRKWFRGGTKKQAENVLGEKLHEIQGGTYKEIKKIKFSEYADQWLKKQEIELKPSTADAYRRLIGRLKPVFGHIYVTDLNPLLFDNYKGRRLQEVSPKTVTNEIVLIKLLCRYAVKMGYVKNDPSTHLDRPRCEKTDIEILEPSEIQRFLVNADDHYKTAFLTAIMTGVRSGELWALRWGDMDWETKKLYVRRSVWKGGFQTPKTKNAIRAIDVADDLIRELKQWKLACPKAEEKDLDLMFPGRDGEITKHDTAFKCHFLPALRRAKLRQVSFHSLRHANASLRIQAGQNIKYLCSQLGHSSVKMSFDTYGHLFKDEDFQRQQVNLLQTTFQTTVRKPLENSIEGPRLRAVVNG